MEGGNISNKTLVTFLDFIESFLGIHFSDTVHTMINNIIIKRCEHLHISPTSYLDILFKSEEEREYFFNQITINETYFFREENHFQVLVNKIFPELKEQNRRIDFWSVTSSTGEEPYSLAMIAAEYFDSFSVLATDVNTNSLKTLKKGIYTSNSFRNDGQFFNYLIEKYTHKNETNRTIDDSLKKHVSTKSLNIMRDNIKHLNKKFDIVFFRNTLIYMRHKTKYQIVDKLASIINPGGFLFLASSEVPFISHPDLVIVEGKGVFYFHKQKKEVKATLVKEDVYKLRKKIFYPSENSYNKKKCERQKGDLKELIKQVNEAKKKTTVYKEHKPAIVFYLNAVKEINKKQFDLAAKTITQLENKYCSNEISCYLKGFMNYVSGKKEIAVNYLRESLFYNFDFWPAHFYLGQLWKEKRSDRAYEEFMLCKKILESSHKENYHFLLEEYNEKYFYRLCEVWMNKLEGK